MRNNIIRILKGDSANRVSSEYFQGNVAAFVAALLTCNQNSESGDR